MKLLNLFFLVLCLIEIYGQRIRTTNTNQDVTTQEPKRGRGRMRFSTDELPQSSERPSSNRRASTRTRIHSNNPKAAADRRIRPTETPKGYVVEEINNDSPIDSFIRQSKPRVLTESRFEIPTITAPRRSQSFGASRTTSAPPVIDELAGKDLSFGSTARAILQARGEVLLPKTTTPVIDEAYLLNNFGSTIRSIAAARYEVPIHRATPLRSEVPILDQEDIPSRRSSLRGEPLPSLRGSDINVERRTSSRGRKQGRAQEAAEQTRTNTRSESQRRTTEAAPAEDLARLEPETEAPESVQGIFEQSETLAKTKPLEASSESLSFEAEEEEDSRETLNDEVETQKIIEPSTPRQTLVNNRRNSALERDEARSEIQSTQAPRTRASRTRVPQKSVEVYTAPPAKSRGTKRRYDDAVVAESRSRGPSVFTAEQYQEVTSRSRSGRRIDSKIESVPERITVDLTSFTTARTRSSGRRPTSAGTTSTERSSIRDRNNSRGRSRSIISLDESTLAPLSRSTNGRRPSSIDDTAFYGDKTSSRSAQTTSRRETSSKLDATEPRAAIKRGNSEETPSNRRLVANRLDTINSRSRTLAVDNRRQTASRTDSFEPRNVISSRNSGYRQNVIPDDALPFGEKSSRTRTPQTTTTTTEEPASRSDGYRQNIIPDEVISFGERSLRTRTYSPQTAATDEPATIRSKSRFPEATPKIDESKLEVLPLFEREIKSVPSSRSRGHRSRSSVNKRQNLSTDHMHVSATENDVKFVEKPTTNAFTKVTVTRTESVEASTSRTRLSTRTSSPTTSTSTTATTRRPTSSTTTISSTTTAKVTEPSTTTKKWVTRPPPLIRESVVAEVNEVTSKSTITRRKKVSKAKAAEMLSRGTKKADLKLTEIGKKASSDEVGDEDNYPEPFKALIQAKKKQEVSRPPQTSSRGALPAISITSTEKVFVTSAASPRSSSTVRVVTTESPSSSKKTQFVNEIAYDNENELDPKPAMTSTTPNTPTRSGRLRQLPKFSEKPKYIQKPREKYTKSTTEKPRLSPEKFATKTTSTPKKSYSTKSYSTRDPSEHHYRRKALRSTAFPPSTTPLTLVNREAKFSAKFVRKETKSLDLNDSGKNPEPKGFFTGKKGSEREVREDRGKIGKNSSLTQTQKPSLPIKKFNASRYSSRYRGDPSQRSIVLKSSTNAPFYIPTIPTPAYIPTVPTIAPSVTPVGRSVAVKDKDLGLEVISFDDPVNTISSADLVNGEFLTTDKNIRLSPMVKDGTTEKPVSIIERIINSLTSISTTAVPNITTTTTYSPPSTSIAATESSAILKLAPKKTTTKDKTIPDDQTNIIETITSEKPTTIIEKIRSSLTAIQSNEVESNRMARLLDNERSVDRFSSRIAISSSTSSSTPLSTTSTNPATTTSEPIMTSTTNSLSKTTPMGSTLMSSTNTLENSVTSTTTPGTTMMFTSTLPSSTTAQSTSTTMASNIVEILAIPGETRISKAQTSTAEPNTVPSSTVQSSTTQASTSTVAQSTETIPPTLSEILNEKTVDALASLLTNVEITTAQVPNFKNLEVNQNSITSTTTVQSTTLDLSTERDAPFTSPMLNTESTSQFTSSADRLLSSTLTSTLMPASTTIIPESTTQRVKITSTTQPPTTTTTTMRTTTPEIKTTTQRVETTTQRLTTTVVPRAKTTTAFPIFSPSTILPTILTTLFPNLLRNAVTTPSSPLSSTRKLFTSADLSNNVGDRFEVLSTAGTTPTLSVVVDGHLFNFHPINAGVPQARSATVPPETSKSQRISTTTPPTTTRQTTTQTTTETLTTTTTQKPLTTTKPKPTTAKSNKSGTTTPSTKEETDALFEDLKKSGKLKNLNDEQRKNLEEIERIEKEQAELLKQLSLLTTMFGGQAGKLPNLPPLPINNNPVGGNSNSLANRVIALAMERDRSARSSTNSPETTITQKAATKPTTKRPNSIQDQLPVSQTVDVTQRTTPSLDDILKQYNLNGLSTPVPLSSTYGKTDEALLAAILREQGIGPTTPKVLGDKVKEAGIFEENPTTKPPKPKSKPRTTTTARPIGGRLMQGLNWLLDILDPPTTKRPAPKKSKPKSQPPKQNSGDDELLTNQPTRITPIVTAAPVTRPNLSQEEIQVLIKQLEAVQNDPNAAEQLDFSKIKNLQNLINVNEGVQVTSAGQHGATSRATPRPPKITSTTVKDPFLTEINKKPRSSTISTLSVSNSIDDDVELIPTTKRTRVLPPVSLNPIPGIDNQGDSLIRSNLLTAAVNVTRAISSFLGSALQDAASQVRNMFSSGTNALANVSGGASSIPSITSVSSGATSPSRSS